jgi:hypothetical protein
MSNEKEFSVCIFYSDGAYDYVRRYVSAEEAVKVAKSYTERPAALIGIINRVIITDGGDFTNFEWIFDKGVTYPEKEELNDTTKTS